MKEQNYNLLDSMMTFMMVEINKRAQNNGLIISNIKINNYKHLLLLKLCLLNQNLLKNNIYLNIPLWKYLILKIKIKTKLPRLKKHNKKLNNFNNYNTYDFLKDEDIFNNVKIILNISDDELISLFFILLGKNARKGKLK